MNRIQNHACLEVIIEAINRVSQEDHDASDLRRAAYLHRIIDAILTEQVICLPQIDHVHG